MKDNMLINVKMPTIVGILTLISRINAMSESSKTGKFVFSLIVFHSFYDDLKVHAQFSRG